MNIIETQDDLIRRTTLLEGDLTILRNIVKSLEITITNLTRRVNTLEQNPSIVEGNKQESDSTDSSNSNTEEPIPDQDIPGL